MIFTNHARYALSHAWVNLSVTVPIWHFLFQLTKHANSCLTKGLAWVFAEINSSSMTETVSLNSWEAWSHRMHRVNWICTLTGYSREKAWCILRCSKLCWGLLLVASGQRVSSLSFFGGSVCGVHWWAVRESDTAWWASPYTMFPWSNIKTTYSRLLLN